MVRTVSRAARLKGEVRVPGERDRAIQALWMAAVSEGSSRIDGVPPGAAGTVAALRRLGVGVEGEDGGFRVDGRGPTGLEPAEEVLDLEGSEEAVLPALAVLARQAFPSRVRVPAPSREQADQLLGLLAHTGSAATEEAEGVFGLEAAAGTGGGDHEAADLPASVKLGLLTAGLFARAPTVVREPASCRDRVEAPWKERGVPVESGRHGDPPVRSLTLLPGAAPKALDVDVPGDLAGALPVVAAALAVRRSEVAVRRVMVRPGNRLFVDLVRQIGGEVEIAEADDGSVDLLIKGSGRLKATRVADRRARGLLEHLALLAVLATQTEGEFIIRDIESLRRGEYDFVDHLVGQLRRVEAKVGEYPEGVVIEGGRPLKGERIDGRGHAGLVQAFAVAGLVAHGEMEIDGAECVEASFPGFFDLLDGLQAPRARENA